jgi:hypothetical protein
MLDTDTAYVSTGTVLKALINGEVEKVIVDPSAEIVSAVTVP